MLARTFLSRMLCALLLAALVPSRGPAATPAPQSADIRVNVSGNHHQDPKVAVFPDGGFVVVWTAGPETGRQVIHSRFFTRDGRPASGQFRLIAPAGGSQFADQVVADRDGSFLLSWTEEDSFGGRRQVFVRRFNRDGTPRGGRLRPHGPSAADRQDGVLALAADGRFAVAWKAYADVERSYSNAMARIFTAGGAPAGGEIVVAEGDFGIGDDSIFSYPTGLSLRTDGSLVVLYQEYEITDFLTTWLVRVSAGGTPLQPRAVDPSFSCCGFGAQGATLATGRDGNLLAVWSEYDVMARRYSPGGLPRGGPVHVSEQFTDDQVAPAAAPLAGGGYVLAWTERSGRDGDGDGIFGRFLAANGNPSSRDLRINKTTPGNQSRPALAAGPHGPVVAVWQQTAADGHDDIRARILIPAN